MFALVGLDIAKDFNLSNGNVLLIKKTDKLRFHILDTDDLSIDVVSPKELYKLSSIIPNLNIDALAIHNPTSIYLPIHQYSNGLSYLKTDSWVVSLRRQKLDNNKELCILFFYVTCIGAIGAFPLPVLDYYTYTDFSLEPVGDELYVNYKIRNTKFYLRVRFDGLGLEIMEAPLPREYDIR